LRLALEAAAGGRVSQIFGEKLDRDRTIELAVDGTIDLAHAARANEREDSIRAELLSRERPSLIALGARSSFMCSEQSVDFAAQLRAASAALLQKGGPFGRRARKGLVKNGLEISP